MVICKRIQWPVGQGGFATGTVRHGNQKYHYVYDCGSDNLSALRNSIQCYTNNDDIECLFVSHLHSDHINGIDTLLTTYPVNRVFLPYISDLEAIVLAIESAKQGMLTYNYLNFLENPFDWFFSRNVNTVSMVQRYESNPDHINGLSNKISRDTIFKDTFLDLANIDKDTPQLLPGCVDIGLSFKGGPLWILAPFVPPVPEGVYDRFIEECNNLKLSISKNNYNSRNLQLLLTDKDLLAKLKRTYDLISSKHNFVSMCLYSGPPNRHYLMPTHARRRKLFRKERVGWMGTGDSPLKNEVVLDAFRRRYDRYLPLVGTLMCPHHGSKDNMDNHLIKVVNPHFSFAAASTTNGHGHPSGDVMSQLRLSEVGFHQISEVPGSKLVEEVSYLHF
ncbi:hypothetical protein M1B72_06930 [Geomonas paludis]|uniref:Metallo-beta-lactamase domain-containing protein n=1 Tax=Geomonas paludis TaxID=2740185 RepID=A0ABY4LHI5_9BACT|nr:MBL fold metallo-hydrolase [Geomonas paludis]UPU37434.1 hypothetical protein M1B72_06930 [Geomonas paludis]